MKWLIDKVIEYSVRNRLLVVIGVAVIALVGAYCLFRTPVDAIPDLSENQVIVFTDWEGRDAQNIEDQITYPLSVNLQGLAGVKSIRASSEFGFSMINIIFEEKMDFYFTRQRVLERLSIAGSFLPPGVVPYLAPDATALGQIFWYTVEGEGRSLDELRAYQDFFVRYQLNSVPGVAQVASVGGFVREYQVDVDPNKLRAFDVTLPQVFSAVMSSNSSVGGKVIQKDGMEYVVRGYGWIRGVEDISNTVVIQRKGVPITVGQIATVQLGPAFRRSLLEKNAREAVGGVVMMRYGENPLEVTRHIKDRIVEVQAGLPEGVRVVPFYDRTGLIEASIDTLTETLVEEILFASLVVFLILWHFRSGIVICSTLPLAVLLAFIFMRLFDLSSNIMSLSGIAISIGVLVDAGIVITENAYNRLYEHYKDKGGIVTGDNRQLIIDACKVVGAPLFFSILIILLSFLPVFTLSGMEGKMFHPLAWTKTFALFGVSLLAITLVPALLPTFVRGRLHSQEDVWLVRSFVEIYRPLLDYFMRKPEIIVILTGCLMVVGLHIFPWKLPWVFFVVLVPFIVTSTTLFLTRRWLLCLGIVLCFAFAGWRFFDRLGEEFMPPLGELAIMDMPTTTPKVNITQAGDDIKERDAILRQFPEVHQVVGKVGRADTPTDPAPIDMVETVVSLRPKVWWPKRKLNYEDVLAEAAASRGALTRAGILKPPTATDDLANAAAMEASASFDRAMRELCMRRFDEYVPERTRELVRRVRQEVVSLLRKKGALQGEPAEARWKVLEEKQVAEYAPRFNEWVAQEDVDHAAQEVVDFLVGEKLLEADPSLLLEPETAVTMIRDFFVKFAGNDRSTVLTRLRSTLEETQDELMAARVMQINWELLERGPSELSQTCISQLVAKARGSGLLAREPKEEELEAIRKERETAIKKSLFLWQKLEPDIVKEMDSDLQFPGWGNIWTKPIINRVDMLATGVRTMVGVKVYGTHLDDKVDKDGKVIEPGIQTIANRVADVLRGIPGAVDIFPDQVVGKNYLEISIDRKRAARYGVNVQDLQDVIEVALGGKEITLTVEGRNRFPVRVRYPRDLRMDEEAVKNILVPAAGGEVGGGMGGATYSQAMAPGDGGGTKRMAQVPLSLVADVRVLPGPSMIKSEDGQLRAYVQLNVRERDVVGFVEEAQQAVKTKVNLPPGFDIKWSGQFENQVRAQDTLKVVFPLVMLIIFLILYMTYGDLPDTLMMFLSVPGAWAGGAIFQYIWGFHFSVAVWIGYIVCFGLAAETGVVMLVYMRESMEKREKAGLLRTEADIREAVMEGAVHRLRPKLLTEGTIILGLIPMLWSTGVGAEFMRPMAAPVLGGVLVADEVIDILIPVLFYHERCRRLKRQQTAQADLPYAQEA